VAAELKSEAIAAEAAAKRIHWTLKPGETSEGMDTEVVYGF
jgi:hypothetical protein